MLDSFEGLSNSARIATLEQKYGALSTPELLEAVTNHEFKGKIALLSSFKPDSAILLSKFAGTDFPIIFIDTLHHFAETHNFVETLRQRFNLKNIISTKPDAQYLAKHDSENDLWQDRPSQCCWARKVAPLDHLVAEMGFEALITGAKGYQTKDRAGMSYFSESDTGINVNPLIHWTRDQVAAEIARLHLPAHELFASYGTNNIGCAPCTSPAIPGQDDRANRWAHMHGRKTECGLLVKGTASDSAISI